MNNKLQDRLLSWTNRVFADAEHLDVNYCKTFWSLFYTVAKVYFYN